MGVIIPRTSYTICQEISHEIKEPLTKVQLVIETYQNKIINYLESGESVPLYQLATLSVVHRTAVYTRGHNDFARRVKSGLKLTTTMLSEEVADTLAFYHKDTYLIIKMYHEKIMERLKRGQNIHISGIITIKCGVSDDGTPKVHSTTPYSLIKRVQSKGYESAYVRTSEHLKEQILQGGVPDGR